MAEIVGSLFGITPESLMAQREAALAQQAQQYAQLSPMQAAQAGFYTAGNRLAGVAGGLMGAQDPEMAKAAALQGILKGADTTSPEGLATLAKTLSAQGFGAQAMQVMDQARQAQLQAAQTGKATAEQRKLENAAAQDEKVRAELAALGANATDKDIMNIVVKYGNPDKVLSVLQAAADKASSRDQKAQLQQQHDQLMITLKQMGMGNQADTRALQQDILRQRLEDMQAKADEKKLTAETATQGRVASFDTALETLDTISTHPGKKDVVGTLSGSLVSKIPGTAAAGFASQLETFKAQTFLPQVEKLKGMGALSDAEGKKLTAAVGALDINMKQSEFDAQVAKIKADLKAARERAASRTKGAVPTTPASQAPIYAVNPTTKERLMSTDGGNTWTQAR